MAVRKTETSHRNSGLEANKSFPNLTFFALRASFVVVDARISDKSSFRNHHYSHAALTLSWKYRLRWRRRQRSERNDSQIRAGGCAWIIINVRDVAINIIYGSRRESSLCWTCGNLKLLISCKIIIPPPLRRNEIRYWADKPPARRECGVGTPKWRRNWMYNVDVNVFFMASI